jgi:hypothetical protein
MNPSANGNDLQVGIGFTATSRCGFAARMPWDEAFSSENIPVAHMAKAAVMHIITLELGTFIAILL